VQSTTAARQAPAAVPPVDVPVVLKRPIDFTDAELEAVRDTMWTTASPYGKTYADWKSAFDKIDAERTRRRGC
jgi:hypothetical protein